MDKLRILGECFNSIKEIDRDIDDSKLIINTIANRSTYFNKMLDQRGQLSFRDQRLLVKLMNDLNKSCEKLIDSLNTKKVFEIKSKELTIELLNSI